MNIKNLFFLILFTLPSILSAGKIKMPNADEMRMQLEQYVNSSSEFEQVERYLINQLADKELEIEVIKNIVHEAIEAYDDKHSNDLADHQLAIMCQEDGVELWLHDYLEKATKH